MRILLSTCLLLFLSLPLVAQQHKNYRSDTLNFSVQLRYLLVSYGAGVEFPFRQHSFGLQAGYNSVPFEGNIYYGFNLEKIGALEYKRHYPATRPAEQFYFGSYLLFKNTEHASPHDADWEGNWYESNSLSIGPLLGYKWYRKRMYYDFFLGVHGGWLEGKVRWDNRDPATNERNPTYQNAEKIAYGIRLGLSFGFHLLKKGPKHE